MTSTLPDGVRSNGDLHEPSQEGSTSKLPDVGHVLGLRDGVTHRQTREQENRSQQNPDETSTANEKTPMEFWRSCVFAKKNGVETLWHLS